MRSDQFEEYLARVFTHLGFAVERTGQSGDQGVDLIVAHGDHRVAVQVKGYVNSVPNAAVQQAYAGMAFYGCQSCAVVTNSRFTISAVTLAQRLKCVLIDEHVLPRMIRGETLFLSPDWAIISEDAVTD